MFPTMTSSIECLHFPVPLEMGVLGCNDCKSPTRSNNTPFNRYVAVASLPLFWTLEHLYCIWPPSILSLKALIDALSKLKSLAIDWLEFKTLTKTCTTKQEALGDLDIVKTWRVWL